MTLYDVLGVDAHTEAHNIKAAYRRLAQIHHPDKGGDKVKFQEIQHAYEVLSDPERRKRYDETGDSSDHTHSARSMAFNEFQALLNHMLATVDVTYSDVIGIMRSQVKNKLAECQRVKLSIEDDIKRSENAMSRFSVTEGENIFALMLKNKIQQSNANFANIAKSEQMFNLMLTMLEDYSYSYDQQLTPATRIYWTGSTGSTTSSA